MKLKIINGKDKYINPSPLKVSTYTLICFINNKVNLHLFSRLLNIYRVDDNILNNETGNFISISNYNEQNHTDMPRGIVPVKLPVKVFNNQITLVYKYWGFKKINLKIFSNGKLQMTGIQDPDWETKFMGNYLINLLKTMKYRILRDKSLIPKYASNTDYITYWNNDKKRVEYSRRNIGSFDIRNLIVNGLVYNYDDTIWHTDEELDKFYKDVIKFANEHYIYMKRSKDKLLNTYNYPLDIRTKLIQSLNIYKKLIKLPTKFMNSNNDDFKKTITSIVDNIAEIFKNYEKKIIKLHKTDNTFINTINDKYTELLTQQIINNNNDPNDPNDTNDTNDIILLDSDLSLKNYKLDKIKIELINSDFNTRFNNNLSVINNLLKDKYNIYRYYQPNNRYAGIIVKFMYNESYQDENKYKIGKCYCAKNCAINKTNKKCVVITISIFRPGSIIITAAKNIKQLEYTYKFINTFFKTHYLDVAYIEDDMNDYYNHNEDRKIIKKPHIYHIHKNNITTTTKNNAITHIKK